MTEARSKHWQGVWSERAPDEVSWYQRNPETSLRLLGGGDLPAGARVLDVGGGASTLVDRLLDLGFRPGVLDVSEAALARARERLGERADRVEWYAGDVTEFESPHPWEAWHDRAALHFLVDHADRLAYRASLLDALAPGGVAVISGFGPGGPARCSGLPVRRLSEGDLSDLLGPDLRVEGCEIEVHRTPAGTPQEFLACRLRREAAGRRPAVDSGTRSVVHSMEEHVIQDSSVPEGAMTESRPVVVPIDLDLDVLRGAIREEYETVARDPGRGFHFHTGRRLTEIVGYEDAWLEGIPEAAIERFAGTGNPFALGPLRPGERVVDIGCGAGIDTLIAAKMVGPEGRVIGVDMTPAMLETARKAAGEAGLENVEFREGLMEDLPVEDGWADVVISNGVLNLTPNKPRALAEMNRVLATGGRLQIADILVEREVSAESKQKIDLWTG